jgi:hypothetical protein
MRQGQKLGTARTALAYNGGASTGSLEHNSPHLRERERGRRYKQRSLRFKPVASLKHIFVSLEGL